MKCPEDCHAHPPAITTCEPKCREHRNHIYIICYGKPVKVRDPDYLHADSQAWRSGYPITHYVGFTGQLPVDRVRQHGALSAHYLVEVRPGWESDELASALAAAPSQAAPQAAAASPAPTNQLEPNSGDPAPGTGTGGPCTTIAGYYPAGLPGHYGTNGFCVAD